MTESNWQHARIIPVAGIGSQREAEARATSAFLAVLSAVRPLSKALIDRLGASRAQNAKVECFVEAGFDWKGRRVRPDGIISVAHGQRPPWTALVEVKTGEAELEADQINLYWDIAREHGFDAVLTISNEIAPTLGAHPTAGLKVRKNSRTQVHHYSWTYILTEALIQKVHRGVDDPEQAWILNELIRYLEHPASGALSFDDMGPAWSVVRDAVHNGTAAKGDQGLVDVAARWVQLLRFSALKLGAEIGEDVQPVWTLRRDSNPEKRVAALVTGLVQRGELNGGLRVPNTAGDIELLVDLRARLITTAITLDAPQDRGSRAQVTWLTKQLASAPVDATVEAWPSRARAPLAAASLSEVRDDRNILSPDSTMASRFRILHRRQMGLARKTGGKKPGFIDSVGSAVDEFYEFVVQNLTPWQPPAPRKQGGIGDETTVADDPGTTAEEREATEQSRATAPPGTPDAREDPA